VEELTKSAGDQLIISPTVYTI